MLERGYVEDCGFAGAVTDESLDFLDDMTNLMASTMSSVATEATDELGVPVVYADPQPAFEGKAACSDDEFIHGVRFGEPSEGDLPLQPGVKESFHPNRFGALAYAGVFSNAVMEMEE